MCTQRRIVVTACCVLHVGLVAILYWLFCTHFGFVWVLCHLRRAATCVTAVGATACGASGLVVAHCTVDRRLLWLTCWYALLSSAGTIYWYKNAQALFPHVVLSPNSTTMLRSPQQLAPFSQWNATLQALSFESHDAAFREQHDLTATHPTRLHWLDLCKLVWLPVLTAGHVVFAGTVTVWSVAPGPVLASGRPHRQWWRTAVLDSVVGLRWWLEAMNSLDSNNRWFVDWVGVLLLAVYIPALWCIWDRLVATPVQLAPQLVSWTFSVAYSIYWHRQYHIHSYHEHFRSVWYDGVWCVSLLWLYTLCWSCLRCEQCATPPDTTQRRASVTLWGHGLCCTAGVLWWSVYPHLTGPRTSLQAFVPYYAWVSQRGRAPGCVQGLRVGWCTVCFIHLCIWWILEENIHTRHLTEYMDMQTLIVSGVGVMGLVV